jgi:hypothetical protein
MDVSKMTFPELLKHIEELPASKRVDAIRQLTKVVPGFRDVFELVFRVDVEIDLPEGDPPYKPLEMPENWGYNRLPKEIKKFKYFVKNIPNNLTKAKKEQMFIQMLETVSPEEAKLVLMIKDKKLKYKGITRKVVEEAIPSLFVGERVN